jgi:hypothetical protein
VKRSRKFSGSRIQSVSVFQKIKSCLKFFYTTTTRRKIVRNYGTAELHNGKTPIRNYGTQELRKWVQYKDEFIMLWINKARDKEKTYTSDWRKRVPPEFSLFHFFHFSLYLDGTKWVCTSRDVPGTKLLGEMEKCGKEKTAGRHVSCNLLYMSIGAMKD